VHALPAADRDLEGLPADVYSIGALDGESWEVLESVRSAVFDDQGNLYALDRSRILKFGPDGGFRLEIGAHGQGPGELDRPRSLALSTEGELVVGDRGGYHLFRTDGTYVSTIHPTEPALSGTHVPIEGALVIAGGYRASATAGREGLGLPLFRQSLTEGTPTLVIGRVDVPTIETTRGPGANGGTSFSLRRPPPYSPTVKLAPLREDRFAMVSGTDWVLLVLEADGTVVAEIRRPVTGRPSTEADLDVLERRMQAAGDGAVRTFGDPSLVQPAEPPRPVIAEIIPTIRQIVGNGAGVLLVARETKPVGGNQPAIDVVTDEGRYVGTVRGQSMPLALGPRRLAAYVERDDLDVERLVVRRLPAAWLGE
jgi:hypothetical protein